MLQGGRGRPVLAWAAQQRVEGERRGAIDDTAPVAPPVGAPRPNGGIAKKHQPCYSSYSGVPNHSSIYVVTPYEEVLLVHTQMKHAMSVMRVLPYRFL